MQTTLAPEYQNTPDGLAAEAILRKCVHCGFCTATCPTYQLLGDELDGPRGRIYLMKQVLEGHAPTRKTQLHLDRCLTCRNCESTCPSGVDYGHLLDIGRKLVDAKVPRPATERAVRWALKEGIPSPLFAPALGLGQAVRPLLPSALKAKVPPKQHAGALPTRLHARKVLLLAGCAQPAMAPNIHNATARVHEPAPPGQAHWPVWGVSHCGLQRPTTAQPARWSLLSLVYSQAVPQRSQTWRVTVTTWSPCSSRRWPPCTSSAWPGARRQLRWMPAQASHSSIFLSSLSRAGSLPGVIGVFLWVGGSRVAGWHCTPERSRRKKYE